MINKVGDGSHATPPSHPHKPKGNFEGVSGASNAKHHHETKGSGGSFLGMDLTEKQKKQVYANMSKMIIADIKADQQRQEKALQNIKNAAEGNPLDA